VRRLAAVGGKRLNRIESENGKLKKTFADDA
jgi:hypothetical protein